MGKTFVKVTAEHFENGQTKPLCLTWTDGRKFEIDRVLDVRQAPSFFVTKKPLSQLRPRGWNYQ